MHALGVGFPACVQLTIFSAAVDNHHVAALEAAEAAELNDGTTITVSLEPGLDEIFDEGTRRLHEKSTWKLWQWPPEEKEFFDADSFRYFVSCPP